MCDFGTTVVAPRESWGVYSDADTHGDAEADARLMSAALDMQQALQRYLDCDAARDAPGDTPAAQARTALSKAGKDTP